MDAKTCLQKMQYVGVLAFATADEYGNPQVRNISAIHYEPDAVYFFTAKGKDFCKELLNDGRVQILAYTKYKEMIRLSAKAVPAPEAEQRTLIDTIFEEQPYLINVYPDETRFLAGIIFQITDAEIDRLIRTLKGMTFPVTDYAPFEYAVTTAGGVRCDEVNPHTMESLKVSGLYFAGEVLDLDANTGGYNLQIAFSTGRLAGMLKK